MGNWAAPSKEMLIALITTLDFEINAVISPIAATHEIPISTNCSLNFLYLSSKNAWIKELNRPLHRNQSPKILFAVELYPNCSDNGPIHAPKVV